jgi:succinate dehydrogenase / fumarate reductase cytochrome b subunit
MQNDAAMRAKPEVQVHKRKKQFEMAIYRPPSPHLPIYKPQFSSVLSVSHRVTGIVLSLGLLFVLLTLKFSAHSVGVFRIYLICRYFNTFLAWVIASILVILVFSFSYHLSNGVRHLIWDNAYKLDRGSMQTSAYVVLVLSLTLSVVSHCLVALQFSLCFFLPLFGGSRPFLLNLSGPPPRIAVAIRRRAGRVSQKRQVSPSLRDGRPATRLLGISFRDPRRAPQVKPKRSRDSHPEGRPYCYRQAAGSARILFLLRFGPLRGPPLETAEVPLPLSEFI